MKTGDQIRADIAKLRQEMCEFLLENRAANEARGLPAVGPAASAIEKDLGELVTAFHWIVHPGVEELPSA